MFTDAQLQSLQQARHASLLKNWTAGKKLLPAEMAEIQHLLPAEVLARGPEPAPGPKLQHQQSHYAQVYGVDLRNIKRWIKRGKDKADPTPLDSPAEMPAWWARCMNNRVPDYLTTAAREALHQAPTVLPAPDAITAPPRLELSTMQGGGGLEVTQAERLVNAAYQKLDEAYATGDENAIRLWSRTWKDASDQHRAAQRAEKELQVSRGAFFSLVEATQDWTSLLEVFRSMRRSLFRRVKSRLSDLADADLELLRTALEAEQAKEEHIFRNIRHVTSQNDVDLELTAA